MDKLFYYDVLIKDDSGIDLNYFQCCGYDPLSAIENYISNYGNIVADYDSYIFLCKNIETGMMYRFDIGRY